MASDFPSVPICLQVFGSRCHFSCATISNVDLIQELMQELTHGLPLKSRRDGDYLTWIGEGKTVADICAYLHGDWDELVAFWDWVVCVMPPPKCLRWHPHRKNHRRRIVRCYRI